MKVLLVHMEFPSIIGGGGRYTQNLIKGLSNSGVETVLVTSGTSDSDERIGDFLIIKRFKIFSDLYLRKGDLIKAIDILIDQIKSELPDILHTEHSLETLIGQIANLNFGLPHFVTHHKTPICEYEKIIKNGKWALYDFVNKSNSVKYIESSNAFKNNLLQSGVSKDIIEVVYPGVDRDVFKKIVDNNLYERIRDKLHLRKDDFVILIPCLIRKRKGLEFLANAFSKLRLSGREIKIIITGLPKSQEENDWINKIKKLMLPNEIVDHGEFNDDDMPVLYNLADVTILGSEAEGLGISLLEAMSCGCPVVGTNVIGINEVIEDGYNGRLCEYGNIKDLNEAIGDIAEKGDVKDRCIKNAYLTLDTKFNLKNQALKHIELYKKSLEEVKQSSGGVLYRFKNGKLEIYLAKHSVYGHVLPKGGKEKGETWLETALREIEEETGYRVMIPNHLLGLIKWSFGKNNSTVFKECMFYGFEVKENTIKDSQKLEKDEKVKVGKWFEYEEAIKMIAHDTEKDVVKKLKMNIELS